ncbi:hypothetical protein [Veillonella sp. CHU110]|uniref:hypothetical protein n=1 Tax=Veillonella sp. CHU110 TaxID=2490947 RepID=UPI000F8C630A|nr:hypothetical protein [Veillonella sp. CHU110]
MKNYYFEGTVTKKIKGTFSLAEHIDPEDYIDNLAWKKDSFFNDAEYNGKITEIEIDSVVEI